MPFRLKLNATLAAIASLALTNTAALAQDEISWRKAAWMTQPTTEQGPLEARTVQEDEMVFAQPVALPDTVEIDGTHSVDMAKMPLAKDELRTLTFADGDRFYRMMTADTDMAVYCAGDIGYTAKSTMIKVQSRFCLGDRNDDGVFDQFMLAGVTAAAPNPGLLIAILGLDDTSFEPLTIGADPSQTLAVPYRKAEATGTIAYVGPIFKIKRNKLAIASAMGSPDQESGAAMAPYDPVTAEVSVGKFPKVLNKRPQFKHITPVDTSSLPTEIDWHGARLRVLAVGKKGVEVEVLSGFPAEGKVPLGYSGPIRESE